MNTSGKRNGFARGSLFFCLAAVLALISGCARGTAEKKQSEICFIPYNAHSRLEGRGFSLVADGPIALERLSGPVRVTGTKAGYLKKTAEIDFGKRVGTRALIQMEPDQGYAEGLLASCKTTGELFLFAAHYPMLLDSYFYARWALVAGEAATAYDRKPDRQVRQVAPAGRAKGFLAEPVSMANDAYGVRISDADDRTFAVISTGKPGSRVPVITDSGTDFLVSEEFTTPLYAPECETCFSATLDVKYRISKFDGSIKMDRIGYSYLDGRTGARLGILEYDVVSRTMR